MMSNGSALLIFSPHSPVWISYEYSYRSMSIAGFVFLEVDFKDGLEVSGFVKDSWRVVLFKT